MSGKRILFMTQTAVMLALLVGAQFATRGLPTLVTGSLVNLMLLLTLFVVGAGAGFAVAALSPFLAFLVRIGPALIQVVPFIAAGNAILILVACSVRSRMTAASEPLAARVGSGAGAGKNNLVVAAAGLVAASVAKTAFLWVGLANVALPMLPGVSEKQAAALSAPFTWPQLVTSLTGSAIALVIAPMLARALRFLRRG